MSQVKEIDPTTLAEKMKEMGENIHLIDVRETYEWNEEHIPDAIYLGRGCLERDIECIAADPQSEIVLYCANGKRSALAAASLGSMGYKNVLSLQKGIGGWKEMGRHVNVNTQMYSPLIKSYN